MNPVAFVFYNPDQLIVNLAIVLWLSFETKSAEVLVWVTIMAIIRLRRLSIEDLRKIEYMYQYQRY